MYNGTCILKEDSLMEEFPESLSNSTAQSIEAIFTQAGTGYFLTIILYRLMAIRRQGAVHLGVKLL